MHIYLVDTLWDPVGFFLSEIVYFMMYFKFTAY